MAGQNDFLIFDENKDNMLTQELYSVDEDRTDGFKKGLARSNVNNKVLHQTSKMCSALGELIKSYEGIASDSSTLSELMTNINTLFPFKPYVITATYNLDDYAVATVDGALYLAQSLINNNTGHNITDETYWKQIQLESGNAGLNLFDVVEKDHILTFKESNGLEQLGTYVYKTAVAGSRYGYPSFYNQCVKEMQAGTPTQTQLGGNTVTLYKNDNGHIFYDIASKDAIDAWYNTNGVAWYYGVDTANARIFLPRNDWFTQNGSTTDVGKFVKAGLPNITGVLTGLDSGGTTPEASGAFSKTSTITLHGRGTQNSAHSNFEFKASNSNAIYGKSTTVQPKAVKKIFYMCVGNTDVESAITDVIDITTSENDTIPLGWSTYQSGRTPSSAFLASLGQQNSGTLYSTFYTEFSAKIGQAFGAGFVKAHTASDITDYDLVINQDDQTFRLPLLNGSEDLPSNKYDNLTLNASGSTYTAPANGWFYLYKTGNANQYMRGDNTTNHYTVYASCPNFNGAAPDILVPCKKGDSVTIAYDVSGATQAFRFIYAVGNGTLYYKVSNAVQNLQLLDVAEVTTALADKIGRTECKAYITETYVNGTSGYRLYSDHYIEQWGRNAKGNTTVTLLKAFKWPKCVMD